ncbi:MAG TPA: T9SS type A sorting domain-containing protein, partial [Cyclobacteriaceae bacterium]
LIPGETSEYYYPPALTQSQAVLFKRVINQVSTSNILNVTARPANLSISSTSTSSNVDLKALNAISIQGDLIPPAGYQYNIRAGGSVTITQPSIIKPGVSITVGSVCESGFSGARMGTITESVTTVEDTLSIDLVESTLEDPASLEEVNFHQKEKAYLNISPNPSDGITVVRYRVEKPGYVRLSIVDNLGVKVIGFEEEDVYPGLYEFKFDANSWVDGLYIYTLTTIDHTESKKLIVK